MRLTGVACSLLRPRLSGPRPQAMAAMNSSTGERSWYVNTKLRRILPCAAYSSWSSSSTCGWGSLFIRQWFCHVPGRQGAGCYSITEPMLVVIRPASLADRSRLYWMSELMTVLSMPRGTRRK